MTSRTRLRTLTFAGGAATASVALLASTLTPVHAVAFSELELDPFAGSYLSVGSCTQTSPAIDDPVTVPMTANGPAASTTVTATAAYAATGDATDTVTQTAKISAKAKATAVGDRPPSMTLDASGTASRTTSKPTSACTPVTYAGADTDFAFTLAEPTWVTYSMARKGPMYSEIYLYLDDSDPFFDVYGRDLDGTTTGRYLLQPGDYNGYLEAEARARGNATSARAGKASISLTFAPAGSAGAKPSGKAKPYVSLPAARSCATHNATAKVTGNAKRAKRISTITYKVNGKKVATLKGKKVTKGKATSLKIADNKAARIEALVTLESGKRLTTKASYLACTA